MLAARIRHASPPSSSPPLALQPLPSPRFSQRPYFFFPSSQNSKPAWIVASNFSSKKTTPHFWVVSPEKSLALTVKADLRLIASREFATRASLRFPRVMRVRWDDMHWEDVLDGADGGQNAIRCSFRGRATGQSVKENNSESEDLRTL